MPISGIPRTPPPPGGGSTYLNQLVDELARAAPRTPIVSPGPQGGARIIPPGNGSMAAYVEQASAPGGLQTAAAPQARLAPGALLGPGGKPTGYEWGGMRGPGSPMEIAIGRGQVTPGELNEVLGARLPTNNPQMGLTRTGSMLDQAGQRAIGPGTPGQSLVTQNPNWNPGTPSAPPVNPGGPTGLGAGPQDYARPFEASGSAVKASYQRPPLQLGTGVETVAQNAAKIEGAIGETAAMTGGVTEAAVAPVVETAGKGILGRVSSMFPGAMGAEITAGSLMAGLSVAGVGLMASGFLDQQDFGGKDSTLDRMLPGAVLGGGLGAGAAMALGLASGPIGWAALGGAALFSIGSAIFGSNADENINKSIEKANHTIDMLIGDPQFGVDSYTAQQIRTQVAASTSFYKDQKDSDGLNAYLKSLATTVPAFLMEAQQRQQVTQQKMQLQAAFGPVYAKMLDRSSSAAQQSFDSQMKAASNIPDATLRSTMETQAGNALTANQNLLTAYTQQVALAHQQLQPPAQAVQDQAQQMMQQYMQPVA